MVGPKDTRTYNRTVVCQDIREQLTLDGVHQAEVFIGAVDEEVYIQLREEAGVLPGICGKLQFWMYGMRQAAQAWEEWYLGKMEVP